MGVDVVHYTPEGKENLTSAIHNTVSVREKVSPSAVVAGEKENRKKSFF
jgi:hypothetical protein